MSKREQSLQEMLSPERTISAHYKAVKEDLCNRDCDEVPEGDLGIDDLVSEIVNTATSAGARLLLQRLFPVKKKKASSKGGSKARR